MKPASLRELWKYDAALLASIAVLYHEVIFGSAVIVGRDVLHYLIPVGAALHDGYLGTGSLLWDSGLDHGLPVIARWAPMVFYPAQWLHALWPPATTISIGVIGHLMIAAVAMLRLGLRFTPSLPAAWVAAFSFTCGGYLICMTVGGGYLFGAALLPVSLLGFFRLAEQPTTTRAGQVALVLALQILCADPQTLFYEGLFVVPPILWFHQRSTSGRIRRFLMAAGASVLALGVSTCQWLPALEFGGLSVRAQGIPLPIMQAWAFHPLRLVQLLSPHVLGTVTPENTFWARSLVNADYSIPWAPYVYLGLPVWAGLLVIEPVRRNGLLALLTAFFLLLGFGSWGPLYDRLIWALPGAGLFRYPEKFMLFVSVGVCLLGAAGLGRLLPEFSSTGPSAGRLRWRLLIGAGALAATALTLRVWFDPSDPNRVSWFAGVVKQERAAVRPELALEMLAGSLLHTCVIAAVVAGLCLVGRRLRPHLLVLLGALVVAADLLPPSLTQRYLADPAPFLQTPASCEPFVPATSGLRPLVWRYSEPFVFSGRAGVTDEGTHFERQRKWDWDTLRANVGSMYCVRHVDAYEAGHLQSYRRLWTSMDGDLTRRLALFGVQDVIAAPDTLDPQAYPVVLGSPKLRALIQRVPKQLPYAHAVGSAQQVLDVEAAIGRLVDTSFDFTRVVLLERPTPPADFGAATRRVELTSHRSGQVALEVDFAAPGYLMLQETYYPGWQAKIDGRAVAVERADAHFLGLEIPPGSHRIRLEFDPPIQRRANAISIGFITVWVLLHGSLFLLRRRKQVSAPAVGAGSVP